MDRYFAGRVAVVTGAGSGIGQALAVRLAADGARLALLDLDGAAAAATARQCGEARTRVRADTADVTDPDSLARCAKFWESGMKRSIRSMTRIPTASNFMGKTNLA